MNYVETYRLTDTRLINNFIDNIVDKKRVYDLITQKYTLITFPGKNEVIDYIKTFHLFNDNLINKFIEDFGAKHILKELNKETIKHLESKIRNEIINDTFHVNQN